MPGEIAIFLLGAQGGVADDFARLHAVTNPALLRYLRATADGDHQELARTVWTTVVPQLQGCPPDDDAWLELVVGAARTAVKAADGASALAPAGTSTAPSGGEPDALLDSPSDALSEAVAALRACPPAEAEVLAMGAIANLGRDAVSRLTGLAPNAVLALVLQGQQHLPVSLEALIDSLRVAATPSEVADLPFAAGLFAAGAQAAPVRAAWPAPAAAIGTTAARTAPLPVGALQKPSVVDIHTLQSSAPASAQRTLGTPSRSARAGAAAAAWLLAVGGISTAAAMSGLLSVAIDNVLGRDRGPLVTADGPVVPGPLPSTERPGGTPAPGRVPTRPPANPSPVTPGSDGNQGSGRADQVVDLPSGSIRVELVVASFDPDAVTPSTPSEAPTPTPTPIPTPIEQPATPTPPTVPPTTPRPRIVPAGNGTGHGNGKGHTTPHGKHIAKGHAKGHAKVHGKHLAKGHAKAHAKAHAKGQATQTAQGKGHPQGHTNQGKR